MQGINDRHEMALGVTLAKDLSGVGIDGDLESRGAGAR